jgi:hypothetical protein
MHAISHTTLAIALALVAWARPRTPPAQAPPLWAKPPWSSAMPDWGEDGSTRPVNRGAPVRVGDRIETEAYGHVHLRLSMARVWSVRPASRPAD